MNSLINQKARSNMPEGGSTRSLFLKVALASVFSIGSPVLIRSAAVADDCKPGLCSNKAAGAAVKAEDQATIPFSISVDGEVVDESGKRRASTFGSPVDAKATDRQRKTDVDFNAVDIQVKFDGLEQKTQLNVSTFPIRRTYLGGEEVRFLATSNYPAFVEHAEIRIREAGESGKRGLVEVIPVRLNGEASWRMPDGREREFSYVLRVYDARGFFDETEALTFARTTRKFDPAAKDEAVAPGMTEDRTAVRNIPVYGGAVTVYGRNVPAGFGIEALGEKIPLDAERSFVMQRILPPGDHDIKVALSGASKSGGLHFNRNLNIPANDWFYVALADLTVGKRFGTTDVETVRAGEYDSVYTKGRFAFYLKGKIKGKYLLTAAADSGEDDIENIFRNLDSKDPKQLLRRIDPDEYYPVYGDDSASFDDAPTRGKFYVKLARGDSHVMWGNYKTRITGSEFIRSDRGLYGANAVYNSEAITTTGEHRTEVTVYAAQPETLPRYEEFLATGGSVFFLKRQDITIGSETITVEIRDPVTSLVLERRTLLEGDDYNLDYLQGVLLLTRPLSSSTVTTDPVRDGALGGNKVYLIAQYEYTPLLTDESGYSFGGRAQHWVNDKVRIGVTGMNEQTGEVGNRAVAADIRVQSSETSYIEAEIARSKGSSFGASRSTDGGLTISEEAGGGSANGANAWRLRGELDLKDLRIGGLKGSVGGYIDNRDNGFSTITNAAAIQRRIWGADAVIKPIEDVEVKASHDELTDGNRQVRRDSDLGVSWQKDEHMKIAVGTTLTELKSPNAVAAGKSGYDGSRLDVGARLDYRIDDDRLVYGFGQATVGSSGDIDRNDRIGLGGETRLTEKVGASAEVSYGTHGLGGLAALSYDPTADDRYYMGYRLDPDRAFSLESINELNGTDKGAIVAGVRRKLSETMSSYAEHSYDMFGRRHSLAQTYGVLYTPDSKWTFDSGFEAGSVRDDTIDATTGKERSDFNRYSGSLAVGYNDEKSGVRGRARTEARFQDSQDGSRDGQTYLLDGGLSWNTNPDWRALTSFTAVVSRADINSFQERDYVETSVGFAYRPVYDDRLNALFKYIFLYDLPGENQVTAISGGESGIKQRSHILSADLTYAVLPWLSMGGKYGFRIGEISDSNSAFTGWQTSSAHLGIIRADVHIIKNWDVLLEARALGMPSAETIDYGFLAAAYHHVGDNFKVGAGYNFGRFSDDLRDLSLDDQGVFINLVGKF